jgi:hypothetical protein
VSRGGRAVPVPRACVRGCVGGGNRDTTHLRGASPAACDCPSFEAAQKATGEHSYTVEGRTGLDRKRSVAALCQSTAFEDTKYEERSTERS